MQINELEEKINILSDRVARNIKFIIFDITISLTSLKKAFILKDMSNFTIGLHNTMAFRSTLLFVCSAILGGFAIYNAVDSIVKSQKIKKLEVTKSELENNNVNNITNDNENKENTADYEKSKEELITELKELRKKYISEINEKSEVLESNKTLIKK